MSTPIRIQLKYWFYPTGNTPAVNFLRDLPASNGKEHKLEVLSLACGDPRNILFSLWCEQGYDSKRSVTFTCCDIEPAVLARNVVLFTLIFDNATTTTGPEDNVRQIWNLFYHFFAPKSSLTTLQSQVTKLLTASESSQAWAASPYGKFIGYLNEATLLQLRKYWAHYAETNTNARDNQARMTIAKRAKEVRNFSMATGVRAAGPFWAYALETMAHAHREISLMELEMHLHVSALWTSKNLQGDPRQSQSTQGLGLRGRSGEKWLLAEADIPAVANLVLVIPRTPGLRVSVTGIMSGGVFENNFFSFHCFFGKVDHHATSTDAAVAEEDPSGWLGNGDLIVACLVPAFLMLLGPRHQIRVALAVITAPETATKFVPSLGLRMVVFETGLDDDKRLLVCRNAPMLDTVRSRSAHKEWLEKSQLRNQSSFQTLVKLNSEHKATHLQNHVHFPQGLTESMALSSNDTVTVAEASPCTVTVLLGTALRLPFLYPFPIKGSNSKVRVARKLSWIEVEVPIYTALDGDSFDSWTHIVFERGRQPVCWSIPRVNLAIQPQINFARSVDSSWLPIFMGSSMSDSEMVVNAQYQGISPNVKLELKKSLHTIFASFAGLNRQSDGPVKTFNLTLARNQSCHTILFATAIRHDLDLGSLVMDAYVVPLTDRRCYELRTALGPLQDTEPCGILLSNEESILWKRMLPALTERYRTWSHKPTCEYIREGAPRSTEDNKTPLCTCGEGRVTGNELKKTAKQWGPFAKFATRIAIAPIFPVPYVESSMSEVRKSFRAGATPMLPRPGGSASAPGSSSPVGFIEKCDNCGQEGDRLQLCGGCKKVQYCGKECQKAATKEHKKDCVKEWNVYGSQAKG